MEANTKQVGGKHYKTTIEHWDYVAANGLDYFQGQITKYVTRWKKKNGLEDLEKALHFLQKYIEIEKASKKEEPFEVQIKVTTVEEAFLKAMYPNVKPSGWVGYIYEGTDGTGALFRCRGCLAHLRIAHYASPHDAHDAACPHAVDTTPAYVNQG